MDRNNLNEVKAYNEGFFDGVKAINKMKENADGCKGCAFEDVESWQPPCTMCKRNCKDYWRAKVVE